MRPMPGFICQRCSNPAPRRGMRQKYCEPCSNDVNKARSAQPKRAHRNIARKQALLANSVLVAREQRAGIADVMRDVDLAWLSRVAVPFSWTASKNAIYSLNGRGHVAIRSEARAWRDVLIFKIREATKAQTIRQNKLWIDIFVQKNNNRGDAVNMVDLVCDAVKVAIDLDDRWFCIRRVDWEVVRQDGYIYVGVGQEDVTDVQICSGCGQALSFDKFNKAADQKFGIGRECFDCRRVARAGAKL